ncbi:MAG: hypothetical protein ACTHN0_19260 [Aquihabitans sp.]
MTPPRRRLDIGRWLPALAPLGLAGIAVLLGNQERAAILLGLAVVVAGLVLAGVPVARWIEVAVVRVIRLVADLVLGATFLIVAVPVWCWHQVTRRRPLDRTGGWHPRSMPGGDAGSLGGPGVATGAKVSTRLLAAVGLVVALLAADYGIGWTWDQAHPTGKVLSASLPETAGDDDATGSATTTTLPPDPRSGVAAMASSPWAPEYFEELRGQQFGYWPFTADRPEDYRSRYINVEDWVRASWRAPGLGRAPVVWFFGGSAMFGEGQRDDHTIPSEIARLAEAAGMPIVARNYGQRGWVHMQEAMLYEQQLALKTSPDLSVFYDGPNDLQAAAMFRDAIPTDLHADQYALILRGKHLASNQLTQPRPEAGPTLLSEYAEHSALRKVVRWFKSVPAGAAPTTPSAPAGVSQDDGSAGDPTIRNRDGNVQWGTFEDGRQGVEIYARARAISQSIGERSGVPSVYFWQPINADYPAIDFARKRLPSGVIDLSDALGQQADQVFIDTAHTNEVGARLIAGAMWAKLKPQIEAWYEANG